MISSRIRQCVVSVTLLLGAATHVIAAPTIDTAWANAGRLTFNLNGGTESSVKQVLPVANGKLLVLGFCTSQAAADYCVRRLNADGSIDASFGTGGSGETVVNPGGQDFPSMMAVGPDGKIVIGGRGTTGRLARLSVNGLLDTSFGGTGLVGTIGIRALAIRGNGKVVFTGECGFPMSQFCVGQVDANGSFDPAFNGGSMLQFTPTFTPAGKSTEAYALTLAPDGSTYLGGRCDVGVGASTLNNFCVAKITPAGALDASFGNAGSVNTGVLGTNDYIESAQALALQADGKLIAAGRCSNASTSELHLCVARFDNAGLDPSYGLGGLGYALFSLGAFSQTFAQTVALQADGKALVGAFCYSAGRLCIARLNDNGTVDQSFAAGLFSLQLADPATLPTQTTQWAAGVVAVGSSGTKLMAYGDCGPSTNSSAYAPCLVRLNIAPPAASQCSLDIDGDGRVGATTDGLLLARIALGMTGNSVVAGGAANPSGERNTWPLVQDYLTRHCGMNFVP